MKVASTAVAGVVSFCCGILTIASAYAADANSRELYTWSASSGLIALITGATATVMGSSGRIRQRFAGEAQLLRESRDYFKGEREDGPFFVGR